MNECYPSMKIWKTLYQRNKHQIEYYQSLDCLQILQQLDYENLTIISYQLEKITTQLAQNSQLALRQQLLQETPRLLFLLETTRSTTLYVIILNIFSEFLRDQYFELLRIITEYNGIPIIMKMLDLNNIEIFNLTCEILHYFKQKQLLSFGIIKVLFKKVLTLKENKLESEMFFKLLYNLVTHFNQDQSNLIFQYVMSLKTISIKKVLLFLCDILKNIQDRKQCLIYILQQNFINNKLLPFAQQESHYYEYVLKLMNQLFQEHNSLNELVMDQIIKILDKRIDKKNFLITSEYTHLIAYLSHDLSFGQSIMKKDQILNNLFSFQDQIAVFNLIIFSNQILFHNLEFEIQYLVNKGIIYKYIKMLEKNNRDIINISLRGIKQLLLKDLIKDNFKQLSKSIMKIDQPNLEEGLLEQVKHLIQQKKDQYM